jgi:hypothetical protein
MVLGACRVEYKDPVLPALQSAMAVLKDRAPMAYAIEAGAEAKDGRVTVSFTYQLPDRSTPQLMRLDCKYDDCTLQ